MAWPKASPETVAILDAALGSSGATRRMMFGCPSYALEGKLFAGVWGGRVFVRLPDADRVAALAEGGDPFEPLEGRPLRMYALLPEAAVADREALSLWLERSRKFVRSLPRRPRRRSKASRKKASRKTSKKTGK
jgi:TfoX/Sxy family transcriptional regulator of competence genes